VTEVTIPGPVAHGPRGLALSVHGHLRRLILNGDLATGTVLNQAELARILGVSRTPMREAFRMLQEEGLIHAEPDRKAVVTGLDLDDLDAMYGARILLEALAVRMTVAAGGAAAAPVLDRALTRMRELRDERHTSPEWRGAHDEFHRVSTSGADAQLRRLLVMLRDRTHPYLRLAQSSSPDPEHGHAERRHQAIVAAFANEDTAAAATAMAEDLAATARRVVGDADPGRELPAVRHALSMLRGERI
jgi:DNA-binding GntR family transcriptional regulator